jgi:hypothetical protein
MLVSEIIELDEIEEYLVRHQLTERYIKATNYILSGKTQSADLKKRKPKKNDIWQFRITGKYRAYCYFKGTVLVVFEINDHQ